MSQSTIVLYAEPCTCEGKVRHNNGGNYHERMYLHTFVEEQGICIVEENTSTREWFPGDQIEYLVYEDGQFILSEEKGGHLASYLWGEATIKYQYSF